MEVELQDERPIVDETALERVDLVVASLDDLAWHGAMDARHEDVLDRMQARLDRMPDAMGVRRQTVEHPYGTLKAWMGATHFLTRTLEKVRTEMSLHVLAYNMKRMIRIFGVAPLMDAIRA